MVAVKTTVQKFLAIAIHKHPNQMKIQDLLKRKNTFKPGQFCRVWAYSQSSETTLYAEVLEVNGSGVIVRYLDREKMKWLLSTDLSFIFPSEPHFKDCMHVAYDEMEYCFKLLKNASVKSSE